MPGLKIPEDLKELLPPHAQHIYENAYKKAYEHYQDPKKRRGDESLEAVANKIAWAAVKKDYEKGKDGSWHKK
jgi:cation transport regulator